MMNVADVDKITNVLEIMKVYELALADFYKQCSDTWEQDQAFWEGLAHAEVRHAENIQRMIELIANKPGSFNVGRPFNLVALRTALAGVNDNRKRMKDRLISREKLMILARDIEQSVLESNYAEIVKTADLEYQTLMKDILLQTRDHKMMMQKKINDIKSPSPMSS